MAADGDVARAIAAHFYGRQAEIEQLTTRNNVVLRLRGPGGCKVLKMAKGTEGGPIRKELMLLGLLGRHGIPIPVVEHRDEAGILFGRPFFIMNSAGDRTVADWVGKPDELGRRLFAEMGAVLARVHGVTLPGSGDILPDGIVPGDPRAGVRKAHELADWAVAERLLDPASAARFKALAPPPLDGRQLCHGDFHTVQCVVDQDRITAVVDWESARAGNAAIDLAVTHAYLDYYCPPEQVHYFLAGYTAVRPLPADYERAYLPARMAQALGLLRVWHGHGLAPHAGRALELFRTYAGR